MAIIGTSDLDVFPLGLGGNTFGWTSDAEESFAVLDGFVAGGGNFIDTADLYSAWVPGHAGGESETIIGDWAKARGNRDSVIIATKVGGLPSMRGLAPGNVAAAADASLGRLGTDYIDLYYVHYDDPSVPVEDAAGAFRALQKAGKIRHVGLSNYTAPRLREWMTVADANGWPRPVALQPHYNLVEREPYETGLAPVVAEFGLGVTPYYALASGFLAGKYRTATDHAGAARAPGAARYLTPAGRAVLAAMDQIAADRGVELAAIALAWLLTRPGVVAPLASARTPDQLGALMASATLELRPDEIKSLDAASVAELFAQVQFTDPRLAVLLHAVVGGTPAYRRELLREDTPADAADLDPWVVRTVLNPQTPLFREARYLLAEETEIRDPSVYQSVLAAVAEGNATSGGIASYVGRKADEIAHPLRVLEDCRLPIRQPDLFRSGRATYRIAEPLVTFCQSVMSRDWSRLELGDGPSVWQGAQGRFLSQVVGPHFKQSAVISRYGQIRRYSAGSRARWARA